MRCKFDHSEMICGPFEKMTFFGEHPLESLRACIGMHKKASSSDFGPAAWFAWRYEHRGSASPQRGSAKPRPNPGFLFIVATHRHHGICEAQFLSKIAAEPAEAWVRFRVAQERRRVAPAFVAFWCGRQKGLQGLLHYIAFHQSCSSGPCLKMALSFANS